MGDPVDHAVATRDGESPATLHDGGSLTTQEKIDLTKWHLDRYDGLRASTANRASVILSASAILFAGDAVVISQLLGIRATQLPSWWLTAFTLAAIATASLVVLSVIRASNILVTPRASRTMFSRRDTLPAGLVFNGTDTVERVASFEDFRAVVASQGQQEVLDAAQVELWVCIQQHRYRYVRLRRATRLLQYAAVVLLGGLTAALIVNLVVGL